MGYSAMGTQLATWQQLCFPWGLLMAVALWSPGGLPGFIFRNDWPSPLCGCESSQVDRNNICFSSYVWESTKCSVCFKSLTHSLGLRNQRQIREQEVCPVFWCCQRYKINACLLWFLFSTSSWYCGLLAYKYILFLDLEGITYTLKTKWRYDFHFIF